MKPRFCECGNQIVIPQIDECGRCSRRTVEPYRGPALGVSDQYLIRDLFAGRDGWQRQAACHGANADVFFPERGESTVPAKEICRACPVRSECLEYALANNEKFGVWGGFSERERRRMRVVRARRKRSVA